MATYRHWSVFLWQDQDDVSHCQILSPDKLNGGLSRLHSADEDAVSWLTNYGSWHAYEKKIMRLLEWRSLRSSSGRKCCHSCSHFTVVLVTDVLLQLDYISGTTYLPVCETRKSAAQNSDDNWKHSCFRRTAAHSAFFITVYYKYSYLLTYVCYDTAPSL